MNCERFQNEIEDFLYGELIERRAAELRAHLADCAQCAAVRDQIERENDLFAQFYEQTEIEPAEEMWEAIRSRIQMEPRTVVEERGGIGNRLSWLWKPAILQQVVFAILLVAISVSATIFFIKRNDGNGPNTAKEQRSPSIPAPSGGVSPTPEAIQPQGGGDKGGIKISPELAQRSPSPAANRAAKPAVRPASNLNEPELIRQQIARAEREYQGAIGLLNRAIAKRRDTLDPDLIKQYESSLALIDDSIAKSRQAMRQRPDDLTAGQFLLAAYAKKVELMQDIAMR